MDPGPEILFDNIGMSYEDTFGGNPGLHNIIDKVLEKISPGCKILDVGCGTGKPVAEKFARAGHEVHGIDISQQMISIVKNQVEGHFEKHDMREYQPQILFDVVIASFSLFQLTHDETYSMITRFSEWLKPDGRFVLCTLLADYVVQDQKLYDASGECVRHFMLEWFDRVVDSTLYSRKGWMDMFRRAGFELDFELHPILKVKPYPDERQYLVVLRKVVKETLLGPYPLPFARNDPYALSEAAWKPFAERLVGDEIDYILHCLNDNKKVLDVGSGYGKLPLVLAKHIGKAYSVEPNVDRVAIQKDRAADENVEIVHGDAENLPFEDNQFDAVVAMWILHYVNDLAKALREIVRVANLSSPHSQIIIAQAAPDNQMISLLNKAGALSQHPRIDHQGYLLYKASEVFTEHGFGDVTIHRVNAYCKFSEEDFSERCIRAAEVIAKLWYLEDPNYEKIKQSLIPQLELHFSDRPHSIGDDVAILVAKPSSN